MVLQGTHPSTHAEQASRAWRRGGMEGMEERGGMEALTSRREEERGGMAEGREGKEALTCFAVHGNSLDYLMAS